MAGVAAAALVKGGQDIGDLRNKTTPQLIQPFKVVLYSNCRVLHRHKKSKGGYIFVTFIAVV